MKLLESSISDFSAQLASSAPVPGGGGASGLAGALGASLAGMACNLTVGKKKFADVEDEVRKLRACSERLRKQLNDCIEEDAAAFEPLSETYRIPKDAPGRDDIMEARLREAAAVPLEIFELCCETIQLCADLEDKCSSMVISDVASGAILCCGALRGAAVNVLVNTRLMKDAGYAASLNRYVDEQMEKYVPLAEQVYSRICGRFR